MARIAKALESVRPASRADTAGDAAGEWRAAEGALLEAESRIRRRADQRVAEIRAVRERGEAPRYRSTGLSKSTASPGMRRPTRW
ncbi:hypothetical protein [Solilutibacter pythonis]|uniref:hypothetical protein n=1 Tax=Solilutibacter pythonis TaxID=2483112 RepID=UPI0013142241|nr:hypothetical protein [Lysobacter pythonis]